ncbi:MAG TPA: hypothetical protein VLK23_09545 [Thermodesulfobacteriota bacterium]|nr:hypothetical protein [Thermodesulfobacteriota bacterium]
MCLFFEKGERLIRFRPQFLIFALGLDTAKRDPTGSRNLRAGDFEGNGREIGLLRLPTLVIQEGGYGNRVRTGDQCPSFLLGPLVRRLLCLTGGS